jgi:hypothetical protein
VEDAVRREVARVQRAVISAELRRRHDVQQELADGTRFAPFFGPLKGALVAMDRYLADPARTVYFRQVFDQIVDLALRVRADHPAGSPQVVALLDAVNALPLPPAANQMEPWLRAAVALELLAEERGFGAVDLGVNPLTQGMAVKARRVFFAETRQEDGVKRTLDLTPTEVAKVFRDGFSAGRQWTTSAIPLTERNRYLARCTQEETGRPEPGPWILGARCARDLAARAAGVPMPVFYPVSAAARVATARDIWLNGFPSLSAHDDETVDPSGLTLVATSGEASSEWASGPHPHGLLCAVALPKNTILRLNVVDPDRPKEVESDAEVYARLSQQATDMGDEAGYGARLRQLLLKEGYYAVGDGQSGTDSPALEEITLLDPRPETLMVVREAVPSFMRGEHRPRPGCARPGQGGPSR